jgi:hypothetical protein
VLAPRKLVRQPMPQVLHVRLGLRLRPLPQTEIFLRIWCCVHKATVRRHTYKKQGTITRLFKVECAGNRGVMVRRKVCLLVCMESQFRRTESDVMFLFVLIALTLAVLHEGSGFLKTTPCRQ